MLPQQSQLETNSPSSVRQQQLLRYLQEQRALLQRQQEQLKNILPPISPARNAEIDTHSPNTRDLAPPTLPSSLQSPSSTFPQSQVPSLPDGWSKSQQQQFDPDQKELENEDDEPMIYERDEKIINGPGGSSLPLSKALDDDMPSTSDFVKKLYRMLEEPSFQSVVCWGPMGDCFIVKDMNECTKSVLPRIFKHSNFASFVRQLNKYDFHKVKSTENNPYGEQSWTFRHPDFHADRPEALENIKRKPPAQRKSAAAAAPPPPPGPPSPTIVSAAPTANRSNSYSPSIYEKKPAQHHDSSVSQEQFKADVRPLIAQNEDFRERINVLERNYEHVLEELVGLQHGLAHQDKFIRHLLGYLLQTEDGKLKSLIDSFNTTSNSTIPPQLPYPSPPVGAICPPDSQAYPSHQYADINSGQGPLNSMPRSEPSSSVSREQLREQIQAHIDRRKSLPVHASHISSSSSSMATNPPQASSSTSLYPEPQTYDRQGHGFYSNNANTSSPSSPPLLTQYNNINENWQNPYPQDANISSTQASMLNMPERQQELPYVVSSPTSTVSQTPSQQSSLSYMAPSQSPSHQGQAIDDQLLRPSSIESPSSNEGSVPQTPASPNTTWAKTWEAMMASPFTLMPLPGSTMGIENELNDEGLQVYTVGHLLPRSDDKVSSSSSVPQSSEGNIQGIWNFGANRRNGDRPNPVFENAPEDGAEETVHPTLSNPTEGSGESSRTSGGVVTPAERQKLRVRRSTFVPGWAVPPHVLLVDDDAVSRRLSSKFLEIFGCTVEVAVDGISAVNKMNLEKYDLVLMDIVMPKLDGVSATNLIRKFDKGTPIISMTGNSNPNQIMTYFSSGMNDILAKPFTKKGLLDMLEKHLMHLKVIHQISKVPRPVGVPPLSDSNFEQALTTSANNLFMLQQQQQQQQQQNDENPLPGTLTPFRAPTPNNGNLDGAMSAPSPFNFSLFNDVTDEAQINPLAGMGVSDEQYKLLLQNIVNGDGFSGIMQSMASSPSPWGSSSDLGTAAWSTGLSEKRPLDDPESEREEKRSRFEVIE